MIMSLALAGEVVVKRPSALLMKQVRGVHIRHIRS